MAWETCVTKVLPHMHNQHPSNCDVGERLADMCQWALVRADMVSVDKAVRWP